VKERLGGVSCGYALDRVPVTIHDEQGDGTELDIVATPGDGCRPVRLVVASTQVSRPPVS
jgi:hypothetical protein